MVAHDLTICIKTFRRAVCCARLIKTLPKEYPIYVLDDAEHRFKLSTCYPDVAKSVTRYIEAEFDIGASEGRNRLVEEVNTELVFFIDDDSAFTPKTRFNQWINVAVEGDFDILSTNYGHARVPRFFDLNNGHLRARVGCHGVDRHQTLVCDYVQQQFVAKTDSIRAVKWDSNLKTKEHWDFMYRASMHMKIGHWMIGHVDHNHIDINGYEKFRGREKLYGNMALDKHGFKSFNFTL